MKTSILNLSSLNGSCIAGMFLLLGGILQAQATNLTVKIKAMEQAENSTTLIQQPKASSMRYLSVASDLSEVSRKLNVIATAESHVYPFDIMQPKEEKLKVNIYPQPAAGHSGEIWITFNLPLTQQVEITIQDMDGRVYYRANHPAENQLVLQVGHHLPLLSKGNYQLMAVSDRLVARRIFLVR